MYTILLISLKKQENVHKLEKRSTSERIQLVVKMIYSIKNNEKGSDKIVAFFGNHKLQNMFSLEVKVF